MASLSPANLGRKLQVQYKMTGGGGGEENAQQQQPAQP